MPFSGSHFFISSVPNCGLRREPGCARTSISMSMLCSSRVSRKTGMGHVQWPIVHILEPEVSLSCLVIALTLSNFGQRGAFMHRNMIGFIAFDFILRLFRTAPAHEIGRASCRERVSNWVVGVALFCNEMICS